VDSAADKTSRIELKLRDVNQLYHTLDPSPFRERSLDESAEAFIVSWARDLPHHSDLELVVHLASPAPNAELQAEVQSAVQSHFRYLADVKLREFHQLMSRGRTSLLIGVTFLAACVIIGRLVGSGRRLSSSWPARAS
jgi:hypothetical protein